MVSVRVKLTNVLAPAGRETSRRARLWGLIYEDFEVLAAGYLK